jgi:hypothetical protein
MPGVWLPSHLLREVAGLPWNQWQDSRGIGGSFAVLGHFA